MVSFNKYTLENHLEQTQHLIQRYGFYGFYLESAFQYSY